MPFSWRKCTALYGRNVRDRGRALCSIVDADSADVLFGEDPPDGVARFLHWLSQGKFRLVIGGRRLEDEFQRTSRKTQAWMAQAQAAGLLWIENWDRVNEREVLLIQSGACRSNDEHIIALAQTSGARLLYSGDRDLHIDFRDAGLLDNPRGRIYPRTGSRRRQEQLLASDDICVTGRCRAALR